MEKKITLKTVPKVQIIYRYTFRFLCHDHYKVSLKLQLDSCNVSQLTEFKEHPSFLERKLWRIFLVYSGVGRSPTVTIKGVTITLSTLKVST
jgi:hypothetical protein